MKDAGAVVAILAVCVAVLFAVAPLPTASEPDIVWIAGALDVPEGEPVIGVWIDQSGRMTTCAAERFGEDFFEWAPRGESVGRFNAPPDYWLPAPRRAP